MDKIVGYAYVVADLFHVGHLIHLQNCKRMCDILIVGVLTDQATMEKKLKPIIPFYERMHIVSALRCVDASVAQETYLPEDNVNSIKPDILFESNSHPNPYVNPFGRTIGMPYYPEQSSTKIKGKILEDGYESKK
ncbi:MAG TPA: ADP-heptose synthase [bacterium]|nr:ADP-heptose synthase [bacterium]